MLYACSALRTSLCVAIARRMRAGVLLAAAASGPGWATNVSSTPDYLAPVETAQFKLVPSKVVRAVPVPGPAQSAALGTEPTRASAADRTGPADKSVGKTAKTKAAQSKSVVAPSPVNLAAARPKPAADATSEATATSLKPTVVAKSPVSTDRGALSPDASAALARVRSTADNGAAPFIIIDKRIARMWLFDAQGRPRGHSAVLLGLARGDDTVPGIGDKPLARIRTGERTTPAGRFVAEPGLNAKGDDVFWLDYEAAVSMHRVHDVNRGEQRVQRLASPSAADNRISYGCVNVPADFYDQTLLPLVGGRRPVVYLLPETRPLDTIFDPKANLLARGSRAAGKGAS
jgi:hypothetical protein